MNVSKTEPLSNMYPVLGLSGGAIRNPCERMPINCICKIVRCGGSRRVSMGNKLKKCAREVISVSYVGSATAVPDGDRVGDAVRGNR